MTSTRVQHNRSSVAGNIPDPSSLAVGEIAINFPDRYIYTKNGANAVMRLSGHIALTLPVDEKPGDAYIDIETGKLHAYYELNGAGGNQWYEIAPPEDLTPYVPLTGGTMTGPLIMSGTATGNQGIGFNQVVNVATASLVDYLKLDGSVAMTGPLTLIGTPPSNDLHAVSKAYVDAAVDVASPDLSGYLAKSGGVMTGHIDLPGGGVGNQAASAADLSTSMTAHLANPDPHPQYITDTNFADHVEHGGAEHPVATTLSAGFMSSTDKARFDTVVPASNAEIDTGTEAVKYVTPAGLDHFVDTATFATAREKLSADRTYYVRTDGNDANNGLTDASGGAFLTWQKAVDRAAKLDFNSYVVTLKCAQTGVTFTAGATIPPLVGVNGPSNLILQGDPTTPANVSISIAAGAHCFKADGGQCTIEGFTFVLTANTTAGMLRAERRGVIEQQKNTFGVLTSGGHTTAHMYALSYGRIRTIGNYNVTGGAGAHLRAIDLGVIDCLGHTVTITGTPAFTFASSTVVSLINYTLGAIFSGATTGTRYSSQSNSAIIVPSPGSSTFFPGSVAGSTSSNGVYTT